MEVVAEQKMPAVAMTDHGNLFGAVSSATRLKRRASNPSSVAKCTFLNRDTSEHVPEGCFDGAESDSTAGKPSRARRAAEEVLRHG